MEALTSNKIYTTINKLPLSLFQDCLCDNNLSALIIEGEATEDVLKAAWQDIWVQYCDAMAGPEQHHYLDRIRRFHKLHSDLSAAILLIESLREVYVEAFAERLNKILGTAFIFEVKDREQYDQTLTRCFSRSKAFKLQTELLQMEIEAAAAKLGAETKKPMREDFQSALITLSDHAGRELDENTLTVFAYCERVRRFNRYAEQQAQKHK